MNQVKDSRSDSEDDNEDDNEDDKDDEQSSKSIDDYENGNNNRSAIGNCHNKFNDNSFAHKNGNLNIGDQLMMEK